MEITVKRIGGIGSPATDKEWGPFDTSTDADGIGIEDLVRETGFFDLPMEYAPLGPDQIRREVKVKDGDHRHTVSYAELNAEVPAGLPRIVAAVQAACGGR